MPALVAGIFAFGIRVDDLVFLVPRMPEMSLAKISVASH